jgi:nitrite reductase (NO-forming)
MMADKNRMIQQILYGANIPMKVNGKSYEAEMTGFDLEDEELSDLANYIRNSFGNKGPAVMPEDVKAARKK